MNGIVDYETRYFGTAMYADDLKAEFDALYAEAGTRRRMMSVSAHDRIAGRPSHARGARRVHHLRSITFWRHIHAKR
jgi:hypothetical protein